MSFFTWPKKTFYYHSVLSLNQPQKIWPQKFLLFQDCDSGDENASHNNNEKKNPSSSTGMSSDLNGKLQELHDTLSRLRRESDEKIQKLRQDSEEASKTIEKLQQRLQQQSDYEVLKREIQ